MLTKESLEQFTGTESYHRWSALFRNCVLTDGVKYLADEAGAYWLMDAIASHIPTTARKDERLQDMQFWKLVVKNGKAVLSCEADSGEKAVTTQRIPYTDFPLEEIKIWVQRGEHWVFMLPSEY